MGVSVHSTGRAPRSHNTALESTNFPKSIPCARKAWEDSYRDTKRVTAAWDLLQTKKFPEFVQGTKIPRPGLLHAKDGDRFETGRYVIWSKSTGSILYRAGQDFYKSIIREFAVRISL